VKVRGEHVDDLALFRSDRAKAVAVKDLSTTGTAAVSRKRPGAAEDLYIMGR
jgi:hypothetical protein